MAGVFKTLSHPVRFRIFRALTSQKLLTVDDLIKINGGSRLFVFYHLSVLCSNKVVDRKNTGRQTFYLVNTSHPGVAAVKKAFLS